METFAPCQAPSAAPQAITGCVQVPDGVGTRSANGENDVTTRAGVVAMSAANTGLPATFS